MTGHVGLNRTMIFFIVNSLLVFHVRRVLFILCDKVCYVNEMHAHGVTSKGVKYAMACPASYVTGLEVGFITLHIVEPFAQSTKALATLSPIPQVRGRVSVIPICDADPRGSDTGIRALCRACIRV